MRYLYLAKSQYKKAGESDSWRNLTDKYIDVTGLMLLTQLLGMSTALLRATLRVELLNSRHYAELQARRVPILYVLWHGRMFLPVIDVLRHQGIVTMASSRGTVTSLLAGLRTTAIWLPGVRRAAAAAKRCATWSAKYVWDIAAL